MSPVTEYETCCWTCGQLVIADPYTPVLVGFRLHPRYKVRRHAPREAEPTPREPSLEAAPVLMHPVPCAGSGRIVLYARLKLALAGTAPRKMTRKEKRA